MANQPSPHAGVADLEIGMLLYPGLTLLDLAGPQFALCLHGNTHLFWKTLDPVMTDSGMTVMPTKRFADAVPALDVIFVPGGATTTEIMQDEETIAFVAEKGRDARYVTSVCSGSLILGMAGLLDGYRAATHWAMYDILEAMGIEAGRERVVADRNRLTGGGVTAGIDIGLTLLAALRGPDVARMTQLIMEYDPAPPFDAGHPSKVGPDLVAAAKAFIGSERFLSEGIEIARECRTHSLACA